MSERRASLDRHQKVMKTPIVSLITPVFNGARTIVESLQSVICQEEKDWELILVDDGSTDGTAECARSSDDTRIRYFRQDHKGRSTARNQGLAQARGKCLLFLDADDWLLPNALADHLDFFEKHPEFDVSVSDGYFCSDDGAQLATFSKRRGPVQSGDVLEQIVVHAGLIGGSMCAMVRRDVTQAHGISFESGLEFGEDWLFWITLARFARFGFNPKVTCKYRWHAGNTTLGATEDFRKDQIWRGRKIVMDSDYFPTLSLHVRERFFHQLLIQVLARRDEEREKVITSRQFTALPTHVRARLLRLVASEYILAGENPTAVDKYLRSASELRPLDPKQILLRLLSLASPRAARAAVNSWRKLHMTKESDPLFGAPEGAAVS